MPAIASAYDGAPDSLSGIQAAVGVVRADMAKLEQQIQFNTLGWFTYEEHADDCSALINYAMDATSATALSDALAAFGSSLGDPTELKACETVIAAGTVPPIGIIDDPHHGICFRMSNLSRLAAQIKAQAGHFDALVADFLAKSTPPSGF